MVARNYTCMLNIYGRVEELISLLCEAHLTDDQLFHANRILTQIMDFTSKMGAANDGAEEIMAISSRLSKVIVRMRRFDLSGEQRYRTAIDRALHVLDNVVSSRLSNSMGDDNIRQCIESLDTLIVMNRGKTQPPR